MRQHITENQREALRRAHNPGLDPDSPGVHPRTFGILKGEELIELREGRKGKQRWRTTELGRRLMVSHEPRFLSPPRSTFDYVDHPARAWCGEPEVVRVP